MEQSFFVFLYHSTFGVDPGGGNGNLFQYSCLENSINNGAWWATVHGVTKSQTWLSAHTHTHTHTHTHMHTFLVANEKSNSNLDAKKIVGKISSRINKNLDNKAWKKGWESRKAGPRKDPVTGVIC